MRKFASIFLSFVIMITTVFCFTENIFAAQSFKCGDNLTAEFNDGKLTISGSGDMYDYTAAKPPEWKSDNDIKVTSVVINSGVTSIGDWAFANLFELTNVSIPDGVKSIGDRAFSSCIVLESVKIPSSVTSIGNAAFRTASSSLDSKLRSIQVDSANKNYTSVDGVLYNKAKTTLIQIPSAIELSDLNIENTVDTILEYAGVRCNNIQTVTIPSSIQTIGANAFENCKSLSKVNINTEKTFTIGAGVFKGDTVTIYSYSPSYAQRYAEANNIPFEPFPHTSHNLITVKTLTPATEQTDGSIVEQEKCQDCGLVMSSNTTKIAKVTTVALQKTTIGYDWYYTGKQITPTITVKDSEGKALVRGTDYSLTYDSGRVEIGTYSIKVTFKGNYSGTKTFTFKIIEKPVNKWIKSGNRWWYRHADGSYTKNNWEKINGKWYHFDSAGWMQTGWLKVSGKWYYLNANGDMATGWKKVSNKWYYLNSSGAMQTGWLKLSGKWYYLNSSGAMVTGRQKIGGKWYNFNSSGVWIQ